MDTENSVVKAGQGWMLGGGRQRGGERGTSIIVPSIKKVGKDSKVENQEVNNKSKEVNFLLVIK